LASENLTGLIDISGASSTAQSGIEGGATRFSSASADIASVSLAGGLVVLGGLHWEAGVQSGAANSASAGFTISSLSIAGAAVPISSVSTTSLLQIINTVLGPTGLEVAWPAETTPTSGTVTISPLTVGLDNSALGQELIGANLASTQPVQTALDQVLLNATCRAATELLISNIALGIVAGGGALNVNLGGASASTVETAAVSPFGAGSSDAFGNSHLDPSNANTGFASPIALGATAGPSDASSTIPDQGTVALLHLDRTAQCQSLSTAGGGCNGANLALPAGVVALVVLGGLFMGDAVRRHRRRPRSDAAASSEGS
jgi:hypothetical protein